MSPKQIVINAKQLIKALEKKGFIFSRQSDSHAIYKNAEGLLSLFMERKTLLLEHCVQMLSDAQISDEELKELM